MGWRWKKGVSLLFGCSFLLAFLRLIATDITHSYLYLRLLLYYSHSNSNTNNKNKNKNNKKLQDDDDDVDDDDDDKRISRETTLTTLPSHKNIAFITFTCMGRLDQPELIQSKCNNRWDRFIFASLRTWLSNTNYYYANYTYYVVMDQTHQQAYQRMCQNNNTHINNSNTTNTTHIISDYCRRIQPLWVDCPDDVYSGERMCCKMQQGLIKIQPYVQQHDYDWILYQDDDQYIRLDFLQDYLKTHFPSKQHQQHQQHQSEPIIITAGNPARPLGQTGYIKPQHRNYTCHIQDTQFLYPWGQPVLYNRLAYHHILPGLHHNSLVRQCSEFQVTHDVGNAILHWMYSFPEARIRMVQRPTSTGPQYSVIHGIDRPTSMEDVHAYYYHMPYDHTHLSFGWHNVTGFRNTETYAKYGDPITWNSTWHVFPTSDCGNSTRMLNGTTVNRNMNMSTKMNASFRKQRV